MKEFRYFVQSSISPGSRWINDDANPFGGFETRDAAVKCCLNERALSHRAHLPFAFRVKTVRVGTRLGPSTRALDHYNTVFVSGPTQLRKKGAP